MPRLIHLNGPPGVGKSTVAEAWAAERRRVLMVDLDRIRTWIGGWRHDHESKLAARRLGLAMIDTHLSAGHDVIVPQFLARTDFIDAMADAAQRAGAEFVELLLTAEVDEIVERFRARRAQQPGIIGAPEHPEFEVADDAVEATVGAAIASLADLAEERPTVRPVPVGGGTVEQAVVAVTAALARTVGSTEVPPGTTHVRTTDVFDADTVPAGLLRAHRVADGVWGRLVVLDGTVRFLFEDEPDQPIIVGPDQAVTIPPGRLHHVELGQPARFVIEFHRFPLSTA